MSGFYNPIMKHEYNAHTPNAVISAPELRLIHANLSGEILDRKRLAIQLSNIHHAAEPRNTPKTSDRDDV